MNLQPLFDAPLAVQVHLATACAAAVCGAVVLLRPKGTRWHRTLGRGFVLTLGAACLSSFFIHEIRTVGAFSAIHLLSILVLYNLWQAVRSVRQRRVHEHRHIMISTYFMGIFIAGGFTFLPGRLMAELTYGGGGGHFPVLGFILAIACIGFFWQFARVWSTREG